MAEICGGSEPLLNFTSLWLTNNPQVSSCFSRSVLVLVPALVLLANLVNTAVQCVSSERKPHSPTQPSYTILGRSVLLWLLLSLKIAIIAVDLLTKTELVSPADLIYYTGSLLVILLNLLVQLLHYRLGVFSSSLQFLYWVSHVLCFLPATKVSVERLLEASSGGHLTVVSSLSVSYFLVSLLLLASQWRDNWGPVPPSENTAPFPLWLSFSWLGRTFTRGFKTDQLEVKDLPGINQKINVDRIVGTFRRHYRNTVKFCHTKTLTVLIKSFGGTFLQGAGLKLANDILLYMTPLVFRKIIQSIEAEEEEEWKGYMWVVLLLVTATLQVTVSNHYFRQTYVAAFQMRTAVICAVYRKTLTIANHARQKFSSGEITNLMSIDAQRFIEIVPFLNTVWAAPFQLCLATYFLYDLIGLSCLAGLAVFAVIVPLNICSGKFAGKFQQGQMKAKDRRILLMNEVLQGIQVLKLYAWEKPFMKKIKENRDEEIKYIKKNVVLDSILFVTTHISIVLAPLLTFTIYVLSDQNNTLTAEKVFGTVATFNVARNAVRSWPSSWMESVKLLVSLRRIDEFLRCEDIERAEGERQYLTNKSFSCDTEDGREQTGSVIFRDASCSWSKSSASPTLRDLSLNIQPGELVAVVGKIGSGKSSLLAAMLGEMVGVSGKVKTAGSLSYVAQQAWIQNMTVQDNILFGSALDEEKYQDVISACALTSDLEILPSGDQTEIGESGLNLSGGQKQRLSLARAAYSQADIVLLDDPLSAVDSHVAKHLFDRLIGPTGLLRDKTRVLVTHNLSYLGRVDRILVLQEGRLVEQGSLEQLRARNSESFQEFAEFIQNVETTEDKAQEQKDKKEDVKGTKDKEKGKLTSAETKAEGSVSWRHYIFYLRSMNIPLFVLVLCFFLATQAFKVGGNLILAEWTKNFSPDSSWTYIGYYSLLLILGSLASMFSQAGCQLRAVEASRKIHHSLLDKTMHAPMSFFETTPTGRTLNRFSSDLNIIDGKIPRQLKNFLSCLSIILSTLVVVSTVTPYFLVALLPVGAVFLLLQVYYTRTRRQIVRLQAIAKSPIFSQFSETINGVTTIRAYNEQDRFCQESEEKVAKHLLCNYVSDMTNRWLSIRVEILGNFIVFFAALFAFYSRDSLSAGVIGLSISYAMQMIDGFGWTIRMAGELESDSVALERVREYEELPQEAAWETPVTARPDWLTAGVIQFRDFSCRYRPDLDNVLNDFSLTVQSGQKVGIVGRTGAGKSSLSLALFRLMEASGGTITIDSEDVSRLGLQDLRSHLTIIPQEPTIFSGTLRFNLDPAQQYPDWELQEALKKAGLQQLLLQSSSGLQQEVGQAGAGFSLGEKQLICLARALLRRSKVLVLDEATAAVDSATDEKIQETIRTEFSDCTVLTIAHRLHTITGGDRIILLHQGTILESGKPGELLTDTKSHFYQMAKAAGVSQQEQ